MSDDKAATTMENEWREFEVDATNYGFNIIRNSDADNIGGEPWNEYHDSATGHRWAGWLARASTVLRERDAAPDGTMNNEILTWFAHGETGISSEAMACAVAGIEPNQRWARYGNHPRDPSDFGRCVGFLDAVPAAREHMGKVAELSAIWARLVEHWDEMEALYWEELPSGEGPKLCARMKEIIGDQR